MESIQFPILNREGSDPFPTLNSEDSIPFRVGKEIASIPFSTQKQAAEEARKLSGILCAPQHSKGE